MSDQSMSPPTSLESVPTWTPSDERVASARITAYQRWLRAERGVKHASYRELHAWSVERPEEFWGSIWDYYEVIASESPTDVLRSRSMPGAEWFPGTHLNYAEHAVRQHDDTIALITTSEGAARQQLTYGELRRQVGAVQAGLRRLGVGRGDRVAAVCPNWSQTVVAMLATVGLGAVWSVTPPEFGATTIIERFGQIEPKVLLVADAYQYAGRRYVLDNLIDDLTAGLPTVQHVVVVESGLSTSDGRHRLFWDDLQEGAHEPAFERVPFDHPLWVLYSSGTTGPPKAIVHSHGGILLEHLKAVGLHTDVGPGDRFFWYTTTGWMMWNYLVSGLLLGSTVVLYDGHPGYPRQDALWALAADLGVDVLGTSPPYLAACAATGRRPGNNHELLIRTICSTGSPLAADLMRWVADSVGPGVLVSSGSGGTDVCTAFLGSVPTLPVYADRIQSPQLGCAVEAYDADGRPLADAVGELVITVPMPSMPIGFWADPDGTRFQESYFDGFPGVWRHGDWVRFTPEGGAVISGRSDATLNRGGVRMGTAEFYRVVEAREDIADSLVVDTGELWLFIVAAAERTVALDSLRQSIKTELSPRHLPDHVVQVDAIPRTLTGKKCEVPVKRILEGTPSGVAVSRDALQNPESIGAFVAIASQARAGQE